MPRADRRTGCALLAALLCAACGDDRPHDPELAAGRDAGARDAGQSRPGPGETGELLDDLGLFDDPVAQEPAQGVVAYDVNAVLYADETEKLRFLALPAGEAAGYEPIDMWRYPEGTRLVKTFWIPLDAREPERGRRLLETRIIELQDGAWTGRTYVWDEAQRAARRLKTGRKLVLDWIGADGEPRTVDYRVPNDNECKTCHSRDDGFEPLGPRTRQLNREREDGDPRDQIDQLAELGLVQGAIEPAAERFSLVDPYGDAPLEQRARSYLDANCSHCHRPGGEAGSTALDLRYETREPFAWGVCRAPVAAGPGSGGRRHDIVAGDPDASIMVFRMESTDPKIKMPELPTVTSDAAGTQLIREWIAAMPSDPCE